MADEEGALKDADIAGGTGASGDLARRGHREQGRRHRDGGKTGEGEAGPASGRTEGDNAAGIV